MQQMGQVPTVTVTPTSGSIPAERPGASHSFCPPVLQADPISLSAKLQGPFQGGEQLKGRTVSDLLCLPLKLTSGTEKASVNTESREGVIVPVRTQDLHLSSAPGPAMPSPGAEVELP